MSDSDDSMPGLVDAQSSESSDGEMPAMEGADDASSEDDEEMPAMEGADDVAGASAGAGAGAGAGGSRGRAGSSSSSDGSMPNMVSTSTSEAEPREIDDMSVKELKAELGPCVETRGWELDRLRTAVGNARTIELVARLEAEELAAAVAEQHVEPDPEQPADQDMTSAPASVYFFFPRARARFRFRRNLTRYA